MLQKSNAEYFENEINVLINSENSQKSKFLRVFNLLKHFIGQIVTDENRYFPSFYAKLIFVQKNYDIDEKLKDDLGYITKFYKLLRKNNNLTCATDDIQFVLHSFARLYSIYYKKELNDEILENINKEAKLTSFKYYEKSDKAKLSGSFLVKESQKKNEDLKFADLIVYDENATELTLRLSGKWYKQLGILWRGAEIFLKDAVFDSEKKRIGFRKDTYMTLEPDHFFDVSDIAECFNSYGYNANLYFVNRYFETDRFYFLLFGNIINQLFDELITHDEVDFTKAFDDALKLKPLFAIAVVKEIETNIKGLKQKAAQQFESLRKIVTQFKKFNTSVEPSFISDEFGLRGRLDLFLEDKNDDNKKTIVELKSGRAPKKNLYYTDENQNRISTGIWQNHFIQVTCYNMLIDSVFDDRTGDSCILYSSTDEFPLRDAPNVNSKKQEALMLRNELVYFSRSIRIGKYDIFSSFTLKDFGNKASFVDKKIIEFSNFYNSCPEIEKDYFNYFNSFIENEIYQNFMGDDSEPDRVVKIKQNIQEKSSSNDSFTGLKLIPDESNMKELHLAFKLNENESGVKSIREGDIAVLYSQFDEETAFAGKNQLFKCAVRELSNTQIKVTLRNKLINPEIFSQYKLWIIESDSSDNLIKAMFSQLFTFLRSKESKKRILYGDINIVHENIPKINFEGVTDQQNEIIAKAVATKDFFLIQGPPGTGKTSFVLKNISRYIHENTDQNIIFLTYTNRAADEICKALKSIEKSPNIIRLGSKEASEHNDILLSKLSEDMDMNELYKLIENTRYIVATVAFAVLNPELFYVKHFQTAIIDEASQILEPQIVGILSKVDRFIMIGDEKQLPAVVTQRNNLQKFMTTDLEKIGIDPVSNSLFERLLKLSKNMKYDNYAMLTKQARMHDDIQELANQLFYEKNLESLRMDWQSKAEFIYKKTSKSKLEKALANSRTVFINSNYEPNRKYNESEAILTAKIIKLSYQKFKKEGYNYSIGVIAPFRAQCSLIRKFLPVDIAKDITVDTVERYQGSERDIVIISTGLNFPIMLRSIESLTEIDNQLIDRKLNVAITRAKQQLIITGNAAVLKQSESYRKLIDHLEYLGNYYNLNDLL